ncbi:hypothetical protein OC861_004812 [Tilletia horrida]|nr:hypothetical protein OC861_004812 [Tilletia horrida]
MYKRTILPLQVSLVSSLLSFSSLFSSSLATGRPDSLLLHNRQAYDYSGSSSGVGGNNNGLGYSTTDPVGRIQSVDVNITVGTCQSDTIYWDWTGSDSISNTVAIYLQNVGATYSRASFHHKRDDAAAPAQTQPQRMHKVRRSPAHHHLSFLHSRDDSSSATTAELVSGIPIVDQAWTWPSINVNPGWYRFIIFLEGTTQRANYGTSQVFIVQNSSDVSCLGQAATATTTTLPVTYGLAPPTSFTSTDAPASSSTSSSSAVVATSTPSSTTPAAVPISTSATGQQANNGDAVAGSDSGVHGGVIAAVVILPLAALIAIGMGVIHFFKKRKEEIEWRNNGGFLKTEPSTAALDGSGGSAGGWAARFRSASRAGLDDGDDEHDRDAEVEKIGESRASVFSDLYGGVVVEESRHQQQAMAEVALADGAHSPYVHCGSVTTGGRPSISSLRSAPMTSGPMPLIIEDYRSTAGGRSYDLPRPRNGSSATTGVDITSPTESEQAAFATGGWMKYAEMKKLDADGAHVLTRDQVDSLAAHPDAPQTAPTRPLPVPPQQPGGEQAEEEEMPYPDTPRPYLLRHLGGRGGDSGSDESHQPRAVMPSASQEAPRSASSMSGKYVGAGSEGYANLQRSASNGSAFNVRRKPVPGAQPQRSVTSPFADTNAVGQHQGPPPSYTLQDGIAKMEAVLSTMEPEVIQDGAASLVHQAERYSASTVSTWGTPAISSGSPAVGLVPPTPPTGEFPTTPRMDDNMEVLAGSKESTPVSMISSRSGRAPSIGSPSRDSSATIRSRSDVQSSTQAVGGSASSSSNANADSKEYKLDLDLNLDPIRFSNF